MIKKIELLLSRLYDYSLPIKRHAAAPGENKTPANGQRCHQLPFEFIKLPFYPAG